VVRGKQHPRERGNGRRFLLDATNGEEKQFRHLRAFRLRLLPQSPPLRALSASNSSAAARHDATEWPPMKGGGA